MSRNVILAAVVVVVVVILAGWFLMRPKQVATPIPARVSTPAPVVSATPSATEGAVVAGKNVVRISSTGFLPKDTTIKAGESVTWANDDTVDHTVNSAQHPTHLIYPALNLGVVKPGGSKSLTFPEAGIYRYHDHLNPSLFGSVTVQ